MRRIVSLFVTVALLSATIGQSVFACGEEVKPMCMGESSICLGETIYGGSGTHKYGNFLKETCTRSLAKSHHKDYCWMCGQVYNDYAGPHDCFMMHADCGMGREDLCFAKGGMPGPGIEY